MFHALSRSSLQRALGALPLALLVACGGGDSATNGGKSGSQAKKWETRDTLVIATQSDIGSLIPVKPRTAADSFIISNLATPTIDSDIAVTICFRPW